VIKSFFSKQTRDELISEQLYEAEMNRLEHLKLAEFYTSSAAMLDQRIRRLKIESAASNTLKPESKGTP